MVNSKRMSKSKVAMIALAILLVLSLILTATGAWYNSQVSQPAGHDLSFNMRDTWVTITGTSVDNATFDIQRAVGENAKASIKEAGVYSYEVMPGDEITFSGSIAWTITPDTGVKFYYLEVKDGVATAALPTLADAAVNLNYNTADLTDANTILTGNGSPYVVDIELTQDDSAKLATVHFGSYAVYVIQAENVGGATGALAKLHELHTFTDAA